MPRACGKCKSVGWMRKARIPANASPSGKAGRPLKYAYLASAKVGETIQVPWDASSTGFSKLALAALERHAGMSFSMEYKVGFVAVTRVF